MNGNLKTTAERLVKSYARQHHDAIDVDICDVKVMKKTHDVYGLVCTFVFAKAVDDENQQHNHCWVAGVASRVKGFWDLSIVKEKLEEFSLSG